MSKNSFGIIGAGMVGNSIAKGLILDGDVKVYDINVKKRTHELEEVVSCDLVFICVPTPMVDIEGGKADLSIMDDTFNKISQIKTDKDRHGIENKDSIFIIKSTIPVGTTESYNKKYSFPIVHCPEFLTARTSFIDFLLPARIIIGGEEEIALAKVEKLFSNRFPGVSILTMGSKEAELVKYMCNCFFATKVLFFNEMKLLADKLDINWNDTMQGTLADGRISHSHTQVPGHDEQLGVGGLCFPKDLNAMIALFDDLGLDAKVMKAVWEQNKEVRDFWDWKYIDGAVSKKS